MKEAIELLNLIEQQGYEAYLIGGAPRDLYLGKEPLEFDGCTNATHEQLGSFLEVLSCHYSSMKIRYREKIYEITTFRRENGSLDHRHPTQIEYVKTLEEDLLRRDFVINTLAINSKGEYVDLLGARTDLDQKIIRAVGDPYQKLEEDALRILRALRFAVTLDFQIEDRLTQAILHSKKWLKYLKKERIRAELKQMIEANAEATISLLRKFSMAEALGLFLTDQKENDWGFFLLHSDPNHLYWTKKEEKTLF